MPFSRKGFSTRWNLVVEVSRTSRKALPDVESSRYPAQVQRVRKSWRNVSPSPPVLWVNFSQLFPKTGNGSRDRLQLRTQNRREQKSRTVGRHSCGQTQILADGSWLALVSLGNDHGKEQTNKKQCMVLKIQKTLQSQKKKKSRWFLWVDMGESMMRGRSRDISDAQNAFFVFLSMGEIPHAFWTTAIPFLTTSGICPPPFIKHWFITKSLF